MAGVFERFRELKNSGKARRSTGWIFDISNHAENEGIITSCVCAARYLRACSSSRKRVASSWAGSSSSSSSLSSPSSSPPSPIETSPLYSSSPSVLSCLTRPPFSGRLVHSSDWRFAISVLGRGSSSLRLPTALSKSTGIAPWSSSIRMRFESEAPGEGEPARFGESMMLGSAGLLTGKQVQITCSATC
ncbi:unnamed protein product [Mycena citricolor]|uniref:Uncharacterized protein n=1 Tax=Mycena citricolor TaxID=2018698 RepID=A0AAD2JU92_9AGAR|nr:unnamed protein product [Mycena citricolor]